MSRKKTLTVSFSLGRQVRCVVTSPKKIRNCDLGVVDTVERIDDRGNNFDQIILLNDEGEKAVIFHGEVRGKIKTGFYINYTED